MVVLKHYNRFKAFTSSKKTERCSDDNLLVTILADLQQIQDKESEEILKASLEAVRVLFPLNPRTCLCIMYHD